MLNLKTCKTLINCLNEYILEVKLNENCYMLYYDFIQPTLDQ